MGATKILRPLATSPKQQTARRENISPRITFLSIVPATLVVTIGCTQIQTLLQCGITSNRLVALLRKYPRLPEHYPSIMLDGIDHKTALLFILHAADCHLPFLKNDNFTVIRGYIPTYPASNSVVLLNTMCRTSMCRTYSLDEVTRAMKLISSMRNSLSSLKVHEIKRKKSCLGQYSEVGWVGLERCRVEWSGVVWCRLTCNAVQCSAVERNGIPYRTR